MSKNQTADTDALFWVEIERIAMKASEAAGDHGVVKRQKARIDELLDEYNDSLRQDGNA
jgi:hypothetical protein